MEFNQFHNNMSAMMKFMMKSHESIIRNTCYELNVHDETIINDIIKKQLSTSFSTVKAKKDPNRVKRPKSAYFFFCDEKRKEIQTNNPEEKMGGISKILGKIWKELSEDEKIKYTDMNVEDVNRYENEK